MGDRIHPVPHPVSMRDASRPRVAILATGSELVRGERRDRNGPFLASAVLSLGLDPRALYDAGVEGALCGDATRRRLREIGETFEWTGVGAEARA